MRRNNRKLSVRDQLLQAAIELFTARGYSATSVREIVEAAGVTKPALYYHFVNKEGIYLAILEDLRRIIDEGIAVYTKTSGTAWSRIETLFLGLFDLFEKNQGAVRFINSTFWGPAQGAPPFDCESFHRTLQTGVVQIVSEGIAGGEFRSADPESVTLTLIGILSFSMDLTLVHPELGLGKTGLQSALDLLWKGVAAPISAPREAAS